VDGPYSYHWPPARPNVSLLGVVELECSVYEPLLSARPYPVDPVAPALAVSCAPAHQRATPADPGLSADHRQGRCGLRQDDGAGRFPRRGRCPHLWCSLTESDADPRVFCSSLLYAFRQIDPTCGARSRALLESEAAATRLWACRVRKLRPRRTHSPEPVSGVPRLPGTAHAVDETMRYLLLAQIVSLLFDLFTRARRSQCIWERSCSSASASALSTRA